MTFRIKYPYRLRIVFFFQPGGKRYGILLIGEYLELLKPKTKFKGFLLGPDKYWYILVRPWICCYNYPDHFSIVAYSMLRGFNRRVIGLTFQPCVELFPFFI